MTAQAHRAAGMLALAWLTGMSASTLAVTGSGCLISTCVRHSDCGTARVCDDGECILAPIAGGSSGSSGGSETGMAATTATSRAPDLGSTSDSGGAGETGTPQGGPMRPAGDEQDDGAGESTADDGPGTPSTSDWGATSDGGSDETANGTQGDGTGTTGADTTRAGDGAINDSGVAQLTNDGASADSGTTGGSGGTPP